MENLPAFPASFSELLKTYRKRKRLTQRQLAQQLGVHGNTVSSWELGTYLPATRGLVLELARCLELDESEARHLLETSLTALAPYWYVPFPRNPFFTGREEILKMLHTSLCAHRMAALTQSYALHGLGGVGKTQLALEYAYQHALEYSAIFWIGAETEEQIISGFLRLAEVLHMPEREEKDQQRVVAAVQRWLSAHSQWLLIWDNVEDLALLHRFLPSTRSGAMLITTRCQALGTLARGMELSLLEQEEAILFLLRRVKILGPEGSLEQMYQFAQRLPFEYAAAEELVRILDRLPLALDQAGAYIEETACGFSGYLHRYQQQRTLLLDRRGALGGDHPHSVATTFRLASEWVEQEPIAADLLQVCAFLHAEAIPEELLVKGAAHLGPALAQLSSDPFQLDQALAILRSLSLVYHQPETRTLSLHRLVQAVLLDAMSDEKREQWSARVTAALNTALPELQRTSESATWKQCERLLTHVLLCLQRTETASQSLPLASLAHKTARYLLRRGQYAEAEPFAQRALSIREQALGPEHPEVAGSLHNLAVLALNQGKYAEAEPLHQRALQIREQALGLGHPEVAGSLNSLAVLALNQGKYAEAEPLFQRALQIRKQVLGPEHPEVAGSLNGLAVLFWMQGKYAEAEQFHQRALQIREQTLGPEHPEVAGSLNNLAEVYWGQGKYTEAEPLARRALQIFEQALGPEHPDVAALLHILANLLREQEKYTEAEPLYWRVVHLQEQVVGPEHPDVAASLTDLAECLRMRRRDAEAEPLYRRASQIWEQVVGPEHPNVTDPLNGLANLFRDRSHSLEAERLYRRVLSLREQHLGQDHPDTAQTLHDLALLQRTQSHLSEATSLTERALQIRLQALGEAHPKTLATRTLYEQLLQERADGAEPTLESVRALLKVRGWSVHLKKRRGKPYVYATRKVGTHTQSRYLAPLSNLAACLAAAQTLPNAKQ